MIEIGVEIQRKLLLYVKQLIKCEMHNDSTPIKLDDALYESLNINYGVFVSFYYKKELRACLGQMKSDIPLYELIKDVSFASLKRDYRFKPIGAHEIEDLNIEISVIGPMKKIDNVSEIEIGKHGIYITKSGFTGTFLPQVAVEHNWDLEEFLGHCAESKVGVGWDGWRDADIFIYETLIIKD